MFCYRKQGIINYFDLMENEIPAYRLFDNSGVGRKSGFHKAVLFVNSSHSNDFVNGYIEMQVETCECLPCIQSNHDPLSLMIFRQVYGFFFFFYSRGLNKSRFDLIRKLVSWNSRKEKSPEGKHGCYFMIRDIRKE